MIALEIRRLVDVRGGAGAFVKRARAMPAALLAAERTIRGRGVRPDRARSMLERRRDPRLTARLQR